MNNITYVNCNKIFNSDWFHYINIVLDTALVVLPVLQLVTGNDTLG
jgi:hypothetical protein